MIRVQAAYALAGLVFAAVTVASATDRANPRRWRCWPPSARGSMTPAM